MLFYDIMVLIKDIKCACVCRLFEGKLGRAKCACVCRLCEWKR